MAKPVKQFEVLTVVARTDFVVFKQLLVKWFVCCQLALFMLENTYFRLLLSYLNKGLSGLLPKARTTLRRWIIEEFEAQKESVTAELSRSVSRIHISFDVWLASNIHGYLAVWGYWIDVDGHRQRRLLAFKRMYYSHSGENQAETLHSVLEGYSITRRLGYTVSDNITSNDRATELLLQRLEPGISRKEVQGRRLRCFGHIVNLAAQSLLAASPAEVEKATQELEDEVSEKEEPAAAVEVEFGGRSAAWIRSGPLGKLQRIIKYILASGQRREEFAEVKGGRRVQEFDHLGVSYFFPDLVSALSRLAA
jgi:hypothetical protein